MSSAPAQFGCEHCGKRYAWKPSLAGKKAKCACGRTVTVPQTMPEIEAPAEDEYDFEQPIEPAPVRPSAARPPVSATSVGASALRPAGSPVLGYVTAANQAAGQKDFDDVYDRPRDFYWPAAVLVFGFIALLAWATTLGADGVGLALFSGYITFATVIKTAVLIGAAFVIAPLAGVSFGTFGPAVLKLAAIVVVTDAGLFWLEELLQAAGALPTGDGGRRLRMGLGLVNTLVAGVIIAVLLKVFFDMDADDIRNLAIPLAILNRILNFVLFLTVAALFSAVESATVAAAAPAATPRAAKVAPAPAASPATVQANPAVEPTAGAPGAAGTAPAPAAPALDPVAAQDADIAERVKQTRRVRNARAYYTRPGVEPNFLYLVYNLEQAGAKVVYVELAQREGKVEARELFVELPPNKPQLRERIVGRLREFVALQKLPVDPETIRDEGNRFLKIPMPRSK
jgi:hypothetical protein